MNFNINKFNVLGYVIIKDFLSEDELKDLLKISQKHYKYSLNLTEHEGNYRLNSPTNLNKIEGACEYEPEFLKIAKNKILVNTAKQLINTEETLDVYISKFFPMKPKVGVSTFLHQDNFYFNGDPDNIISCALYFQNTNKENGCLRIIPGSHKIGIIPHDVISHIEGIQWIDETKLNPNWILDLELDAPYAVFFNINMIHGCYPNTSNNTRFSLAWEYIESNNNNVASSENNWCDRNLVG
jgi:ectoine hydroxylase-related dioxygenase (phytanoyl-CoA dioxygenase family)